VKVNDVEPFNGTLAAPNAFMITGGAVTVILAFDVLPGPLSVAVIWVLLFFTPPVVPVTFAETVHEVLGASVLPESATTLDPAVAVAIPPQVLVRAFGVAMINPAGRLSVNAIPVSGIVFAAGLVIVNVRLVEPFNGMLAAPNAFTIVGGVPTVKFAVAVLPVPPLVEETAPVVFTN